MIPNFRTCSRCVMDDTAVHITYDENGVCSYCVEFDGIYERLFEPDVTVRERRRAAFVERVKDDGKGKRYDCIVGVSGGVDSSFTLMKAKELGLRPLAVHMDNGWDSELAQNNIANLVRGLDVDLHTHVIDWPEYRGLMEAFFAADVIDVELLADNALLAVNYRSAARNGVRYILAGTNLATEGMQMPRNWNWMKYDARNIRAITKQFGGPRLKTFPTLGTLDFARFVFLRGIRFVSFLDMFDYRKAEALEMLIRDYGYKPYEQKHYESVFTRFFQGYILPEKFGVDKRKLHWSTLAVTGQVTRDEALAAVRAPTYSTPREMRADRDYFIKKMGWSGEKLDSYIARPEVPHDAYHSERALWERLEALYRRYRGRGIKV